MRHGYSLRERSRPAPARSSSPHGKIHDVGRPAIVNGSDSARNLALWLRRPRSLDPLSPALYLHGIPNGDFLEALTALLEATSAESVTPR